VEQANRPDCTRASGHPRLDISAQQQVMNASCVGVSQIHDHVVCWELEDPAIGDAPCADGVFWSIGVDSHDPKQCAIRRIRSAVPTTSGQSFRDTLIDTRPFQNHLGQGGSLAQLMLGAANSLQKAYFVMSENEATGERLTT
jgi:hypothetical protein